MPKFLLILVLSALGFAAEAQSTNPKYNKALADSLGADDYGMKMYTLVILKTGTNTTAGKAATDSLFRGHISNMDKMVASGKLIIAGPLGKNDKTYRGIFVLNTSSQDEVKALLDTDPAIKARLLDAETYPWYGSAALPLYLKSHDSVQKKSF